MTHDPLKLRWLDTLWILALPIYLLVGTALHEGSHALIEVLVGARVEAFTIVPTSNAWGAVRLDPRHLTNVGAGAILVAPYVMDLALFTVAAMVLAWIEVHRRWLELNLAVIGLAAPIVDTANNYAGHTHGHTDAGLLLRGRFPVHWFFGGLLAVYLVGLIRLQIVRRARYVGNDGPPNNALQQTALRAAAER